MTASRSTRTIGWSVVAVGFAAGYAYLAYHLAYVGWAVEGPSLTGRHGDEIAAFAVTLPVSAITLPLTYLFAAFSEHVVNGSMTASSADVGHSMGLWFAGLALMNVGLLWLLIAVLPGERRKTARRRAKAEPDATTSNPYLTS